MMFSVPPGKDRWRSALPLVLVYHSPLQIATFWEWLAMYFPQQCRMVLGLEAANLIFEDTLPPITMEVENGPLGD